MVMMLSFVLLFIVLPDLREASHSWQPPWYPVFVPVSSTTPRHTTHVVTHPIIKAKIVVVDENRKREPHGESDSSNDYFQSSHDSSHEDNHDEYKYGYQPEDKDEDHGDRYYPKQNNNELYSGIRNHPKYQHSLRIRYEDQSGTPKYSVPVELSSWRPLLSPSTGYWPLRYLDEDGRAVSKAFHGKMRDMEPDPDPHIILPIGMRKLHNPQLRHPRKYRNYIYENDNNLGVHYDKPGETAMFHNTPAMLRAKNSMKNIQMLRKLTKY